MVDDRDPAKFRKLRKRTSSLSLSCFHGNFSDTNDDYQRFSSPPTSGPSSPYFPLPSWFRSKNVARKMAHHRRRHSADFSYDAVSYSRNFDLGEADEDFHSVFTPPHRRLRDLELPSGRTRSATISPGTE